MLWLIEKCAKENGLGINPKKSKCLVIGKKQLSTLSLQKLYINHTPISYEVNAVNLGITFNNTLSWGNHIVKATGRTYALLRKFSFSKSFLTEEVRLLIAKVILLPTLFYGIEIFRNCDVRDLRTLTVAFNSVVRYVFNLRRFDHVSELTYKILDLNLTSWIDLRILIFFHKIVTSGEPKYLFNKLTPATSVRTKNYICPYQK